MEEDTFECEYCEAEFKVIHEHINDVQYCPFCSTPLTFNGDKDNDDEDKDLE